ncbi:phospholipase A and acyltransferase 3 [Magallana gigas]|uniref:phospholipase A and acyltransferase 3 n=1 Tax=Magallana gigas TaxID=29159 RepID=UPI00334275DE
MAAKQFDSHNRSVIRKARKGDQLEFHRGWYSHWAVYIGNEEVIHLAGDENDGLNGNINPSHAFTICGKSFNKAVVKRENVWKVVLDSKVEVNNNKDRKCKPRRPHEIVEEAIMKIGDIGYNVLWQNCEHFAAYCRYGVNWSEQANNFLGAVVATGAVVVLGSLFKEMFIGDKKEKEKA